MIKKYLILFFLVFNCNFLVAQEKTGNKVIDSLFNVLPNIKIDSNRVINLNLISEEYKHFNPNLGIVYGNNALLLSKKIKWNDGIALSLKNIGKNYSVMGQTQSANLCFDKAFTFVKNKLYLSYLLNEKGALEISKSNYSKALDYFFKSLKICEVIKSRAGIARCYCEIGLSYCYLRDIKKAMIFNNKSIIINTQLKLEKELCDNYSLMGEIYRDDNKQYEKALVYFFKALKLGTKINNQRTIAYSNSTICNVYQFLDKYDLALKHIFAGKKIAQEINDYRLVTSFKVSEGLIYLLQFEQDSKNPKKQLLLSKAETLLLDALTTYRKFQDKFNISVCYDTLTYLYQLQNKDKKATLMALKYAGLKDSIFSEKSKETVKNLEDQRTIELKNKQIEINKITLESKEKQKWLYIFGIGFLTIFGLSLFYQNQSRKKINKKLELLNTDLNLANKTKVKFLSILNHDLRSPVYNFIHFMKLQKESPELLDNKTKTEIETKTILSAENLLFSMEDLLLWSKGELENFEPKFKLIAINDIFDYTKKHFESEQKVTISYENPENIIVYTDENFLKTIVRNLTGNAIKSFSGIKNPRIIWRAYKLNNQFILSIIDNGIGADNDRFMALYDDTEVIGIKSGLGLHLIRDLAKAINCEISVESKVNDGTTFILKFKK